MRESAAGLSLRTVPSVLRKTVLAVFTISFISSLLIITGCDILGRGDLMNEIDNSLIGNIPPIADAGADFGVITGNTATLDGSASFDTDGDPLTYIWSFTSVPVGSILTDGAIAGRFTVSASFVPDIDGTYILDLQVDDGELTDADTIDIVASTGNTPPVAMAGADVNVTTGFSVALDGSTSFDADGDLFTFMWTFTSRPVGSGLTDGDIAGINTAAPSFLTDVTGIYILELTVYDGTDTGIDTVSVTAIPPNTVPVADAGTPQSGFENTTFTLDGSGSSDGDGDALTYAWIFSSRPVGSNLGPVDIIDSDTTTPSFTPDVPGNFLLELTVNDGTDTNSDTVVVTSNEAELVGEWLFDSGNAIDTSTFSNDGTPDAGAAPTADRAGNPDHAFSFDGTNTATIYHANDPSLDFTDAISVVCWVRPDDIVGEGRIFSKRNNIPPSGWELYIGENAGDTAMFFMSNGGPAISAPMAGTADGDWAHVAVTWCPGDPADQLKFYYNGVSAGTAAAATPMDLSTTGLYMGRPGYASVLNFLGAIDDARLYHGILSADDIATSYAAAPPNTPPSANAGLDDSAFENTTVTLDGSASSDVNPADVLTYTWAFSATPVGSILTGGDITGINTSAPSFVPDMPGLFTLELTVNDGTDIDTDSVTMSIDPAELVGEWLFSGGSLDDTSGFGSNGTANGATPTPDRAGNIGAAYFFDGSTDNIDLGNGAQLNHTDMMSFSCWFRADDIDTDYGRLISKRENGSPDTGWGVSVGTGDKISSNRAGFSNASNTGPGIIQGNWYHMVFTWDPNAPSDQIKFYLDGVLLGGTLLTDAANEAPVSPLPLTLGSAAYNAAFFMGAIDDVRYYHGILSAEDVAALSVEAAAP